MEHTPTQTDSLLKRLSGPSSGKAGLAKDQTEINKIIAEVSKGSKFYEVRDIYDRNETDTHATFQNEKRKDAQLTVRIEKLLALRDSLMKNARIGSWQRSNRNEISHRSFAMRTWMRSMRRLRPWITHHLKVKSPLYVTRVLTGLDEGTAFGVGIGVLSTASYEARKFGVRSGMASAKYDPNLLAAGCDEGYLNLTSVCEEANESPEVLVQRMRDEVYKETGLTMSCGVAPNKICSDLNKPNGQYIMSFDRSVILEFTRKLPMRKTCGDVFTHRAQLYLLSQQNKLHLHSLLCAYLGVHDNTVAPYTRDSRRSLGYERTFNPQNDSKVLLETLDKIAEGLAQDCEKRCCIGSGVILSIVPSINTDRVSIFPSQATAQMDNDQGRSITELLVKEFPLCLRLMGLRLTNLKDLKEDTNAGLKRFWAQGPGVSKAGNMKPIDEESDADSDLGLWEVDSHGEPVIADTSTPSKHLSTTVPNTCPESSCTKGPTFKQTKLSISRGSVPLERSSAPKRKRSASVGPSLGNKSSKTDPSKRRPGPLPTGPKTVHKIVIDVDSLCPDCLQDIDLDHQRSATCPQAAKEDSLADKNKLTGRATKQSAQANIGVSYLPFKNLPPSRNWAQQSGLLSGCPTLLCAATKQSLVLCDNLGAHRVQRLILWGSGRLILQ
ncbi:DNA polymerase IV [Rhizoctonia solani AG-1 IA]|uniref:DNA polymerase IV n=1 Tax=Thanatephorus cucumeris (strain AG1-IA) TaxID=983506 RepID=L8WRH3_THACA|nr:DNA polymerase IV [Rhizoctonia solani AG-1 IA]